MKRSFALLSAATLTTVVAMFGMISMLAGLASPINANQAEVVAPSAPPDSELQLNAVATAEARQRQVVKTLAEREKLLQAQVVQLEQRLTELDEESQLQVDQRQAQVVEVQAQSNQVSASIVGLQAQIAALQQTMQVDNQTYETELAAMVNSTAQLQQQLEMANAQLAEAYNRLEQQQAEVVTGWQYSVQNQVDSNASRNAADDDHYEEDDDDEDDHHEEEEEDDDDDDDDGEDDHHGEEEEGDDD